MGYASKDEIKAMFRDFASNTEAAVDDTDLDLFIENSTAQIDAEIGALYALPITLIGNPLSFAILKQLQMYEVACIVDDIINSYSESDKKPMWCKKYTDLMTKLIPKVGSGCKRCIPQFKLPDAIYLGTETQKSRITLSSTSGTQFQKGVDAW